MEKLKFEEKMIKIGFKNILIVQKVVVKKWNEIEANVEGKKLKVD
jgi:hypothetical protein